jgi:hypothetical protein
VVRPEPGWTFDRLDELNARDHEATHGISLDEARWVFDVAHEEVVALVRRMSWDDLNNPARYPWLGFEAAHTVAGNSFGHYREHAEWLGG